MGSKAAATEALGAAAVFAGAGEAREGAQAPAVTPPSRWRRIGGRSLAGLRIALGAAMGLWVGDGLVLLWSRGGATWTQWLTGVGAALFVAATTAVVVGAILGPVLLPLSERAIATARDRWKGLAAEGPHAVASVALTLVTLTAVWSVVANRVIAAILFGVARADSTELALTASHVAFAATIVLAWPLGLRAARAVVDAAARVRGLRWPLERTWRVVACVGAVLLVAGVAAIVFYRHELRALSWLRILPLAFIVPGGLAPRELTRMRPPWGRRLARVAAVVVTLAIAGSAVAALRVRPESTTAQLIGFDRAWSGRLGMSAWTFALDFDRDGQIHVLGGGDCAPFDARRHTGAPDLPGNHLDEDCDGVDLPAQAFRPRPRGTFARDKVPPHANVVLITIDALAAPRLSALGSPEAFMPHVDAFAASSMLFAHCFSQGPSTRLSFPSMFTSRWDSQLVFSFAPRIPYSVGPKEKQIQDLVDDGGYDTVAILPEHYFDRLRWPGITRGFQHVDISATTHTDKHNAAQVTDAALRALSEQRERPLYLWAHYYDAHPPYNAVPGVHYTDRDDLTYYQEELRFIDKELARLLDALAQRADPTYVILTSDHATVFHPNPESRRFHYGYDLYTATLHVPLVIHGPGIPAGRVDDIVSTMDVAPTILDLMQLPQSQVFVGSSLSPELFGGQHDGKRLLFHEYYLPEFTLRGKDPLQIVSVRDARWDLILDRDRGIYELYDWNADYYEQHDLYEGMSRTQEVGRLRSALANFLVQFDTRPPSAVVGPPPAPEKSEP